MNDPIYFDSGYYAFKTTETNCILVCYGEFINKAIEEQPDNKDHYIKHYGSNRITKAEFDKKFEEVFTYLLNQ